MPLIMPRLRPWPTLPGFTDASMMLLPLPRAPKLVPPIPHVCVVLAPVSTCHWMPNSAGLVGGDFDDQRLDKHLRAPHVELVDHRAQVVVDGLRAR